MKIPTIPHVYRRSLPEHYFVAQLGATRARSQHNHLWRMGIVVQPHPIRIAWICLTCGARVPGDYSEMG